MRKVIYFPDLNVTGEVLSPGYAISLVRYVYDGVEYEVCVTNEEFIERDEEEDNDL